ncbi:hypothetical protein [Microtetraspora glauca]|uniref:Uncharacterized protein n=1 Tax=Microtetraspora glauca TaxID=1996 RepID=A0ABV3GA87_MICGL
MCDHHSGNAATLLIGITTPDGTIHTRTWHVCPVGAEQLAVTLGPAMRESIATPDAQEAIGAALLATPGVVLEDHDA